MVASGSVPDPKTVRFMAASPDAEQVKAVLHAVASVLKLTSADGPAGSASAPPAPGEHYVYGYFDNPDRPRWDDCFYVGKGVNSRWTEHVRQRTRTDVPVARTEKERRIDAWIGKARTSANPRPDQLIRQAENNLVRLIGRWNGPFAEACAFAAEYALISGVRGAFRLANETSGNGQSGGLRVLVREAGLDLEKSAHSQVWDEAVRTFFCRPDAPILKSRIRPSLILLANLPIFTWLDPALGEIGLMPSERCHNQNNPLPDLPAHFGIEGASDVSITYAPSDNRPFRIQLKLSHKNAAAVINIRPRHDTAESRRAFFAFMDMVRPKGVALASLYKGGIPIRNAANSPFFKPFAKDGNGKADTFFPLRQKAGPVLTSPNWATNAPLLLTLQEALKLFLDAFADPA